MAKTNAEKQDDLRIRRDALGQKEMRSIYVTNAEEAVIKPKVRAMLKEMRKGT